jgi:hypothetical protein
MRGYAEEQEQRYIAEWERTRWLATMLIQPHAKKGQRITPERLAVFPWEKKATVKASAEGMERNKKLAEEISYLRL